MWVGDLTLTILCGDDQPQGVSEDQEELMVHRLAEGDSLRDAELCGGIESSCATSQLKALVAGPPRRAQC